MSFPVTLQMPYVLFSTLKSAFFKSRMNFSGLDLMVDPYTHSTSGTVRVVAMQDCDIAIRHPESFSRGNNTL